MQLGGIPKNYEEVWNMELCIFFYNDADGL